MGNCFSSQNVGRQDQKSNQKPLSQPVKRQESLQTTPIKEVSVKRQETVEKRVQKQPQEQVKVTPPKIIHRLNLRPEDGLQRQKIYEISQKFPLVVPYSNQTEFQKILQRYRLAQQQTTPDLRPLKSDYGKLSQQIIDLKDRNWIQDLLLCHQQYISSIYGNSFDCLTKHKKLLQLREQFNWQVWAMAQVFFNNREAKGVPLQNSSSWYQGFSFKGVWYQVYPIEDALHITNEIKSLRLISVELMDLLQDGTVTDSKLPRQLIIPLISCVKCAGFLLYGTPVIYLLETQKADEIPRMSVNQVLNNVQKLQTVDQFDKGIKDSVLDRMPTLKNLSKSNLLAIIDQDQLKQNPETERVINYMLVNTVQCLKSLSVETTNCLLFHIPVTQHEEIIFRPYPQDHKIDFEDLNKLISLKNNSHSGDHPMSRGDTSDSSFVPTFKEIDQEISFKVKHFIKHGWKMMIIENANYVSKPPENRRATHLFGLKESLLEKKVVSSVKTNQTESKPETTQQTDEQIFGPTVVSANLKKNFTILPSLIQHNYPQGIEMMYNVCLQNVAQTLDNNIDRFGNQKCLKEFMHSRGLNLRFLWLLLTKLTSRKARDTVMISIMLRVMKKVVFSRIKQKSQKQFNFQTQISSPGKIKQDEYKFCLDDFKDSVCIFTNAVIKNKFAKYKSIFDETLIGIFLHRCKAISLAQSIYLRQSEFNYLESKDILDHVLESPSKCPTLFLNSIQTYFNFQFTQEFQRSYRQDSFSLISRSQPVVQNDIRLIELNVQSAVTLKQQSYFILAKQISFNQKNQDNLRQRSNTSRSQQSEQSVDRRGKDTQRQFKNFGQNTQYQNIIDVRRKVQMPSVQIQLPSILYKLKTSNQQKSVLQPFYEMPGIDTLNEWVMILESLFKDVLSITAENQDQALLEALSMLTIVQILQEENVESSVKNLQKIRDLLFESILVSPELVSTIMLITGLYNDLSEEMIESFPQESEKYYIASLVQLFQVIGDPRGRGNFGLPIILFITQKLQLLALASKKIQDSEVAEEIFDACLQGKHKSAFNRQIQQATGEQHQKEIHDEFNILKYQERPKNVLTAGGFVKATDVYLRQSTKRKNTEIQVSDVTIKIEDDDAQRFLKELNFKAEKDEQIPFQHWMVSRQIYQQILLSLKKEKEKDQKNLLRTLIRQSINSHQPQALLQWLIHYNPTSMQSGFMWESHTVKEFVFSNTTIISQQGSSGFSNSGFSQRSGKSELQDNLHSRQKRQFLGSYTQLFGQEYGGMNRQEVQGLLYVWGTDSQGQLGVDSPGQKFLSIQNLRVLHPRLCIPLKNEILKEVCCGYSFTFALNQYSQAYCWGSNEFGQLGLGPEFLMVNQVRVPQFNPLLINVQKISAGNEHGIALLKTGDVFSWGSSNLTGLNDANHRHIPTQVNFKSIHKAAQIACGGLHTCVVMKNGEMYSWGSNEGGQLGLDARHAMLECIKTPVMVQSLQKEFIVDVACGETHTVALTKQGTVWGWGMSMYGQLGLGFSADSFEPGIGLARSKVPKPTEITPHLPPDVKIKKIICGAAFTLFQTEQGEIYGCGINDLGQLGLDTYLEQMQLAMLDRARLKNGATQTSSDVTIPSKVICFEKMNVHQVACGENHSLAVIGEDSNMLWSWGMYKQGQLGLGEINQKMNPRPVQTLCSSHVHRIAAGSMHSVALIGDEKQLGGLVHNFFLNSDLLFNPWIIDIRLLKQLNN